MGLSTLVGAAAAVDHGLSDRGTDMQPQSTLKANVDLVVRAARGPYSNEIVAWRVFDGYIDEGWDIPTGNTVRPHPQETE